MKPRSPIDPAAIVAAVLAVAGLAFFGLRSGSVEVVVDDGPAVAPPGDGSAVIAVLRQSGGFSLFGLRLTDSMHLVEVQFITEPGCSGLLAFGDPWPTLHSPCIGPAELIGKVAGLGITESGQSLVGVEFEVSRTCFAALQRGMPWPAGIPECDPPR